MSNYKKMYSMLFNKIIDIIEELEVVKQLTEELYMQEDNEIIIVSLYDNRNKDEN